MGVMSSAGDIDYHHMTFNMLQSYINTNNGMNTSTSSNLGIGGSVCSSNAVISSTSLDNANSNADSVRKSVESTSTSITLTSSNNILDTDSNSDGNDIDNHSNTKIKQQPPTSTISSSIRSSPKPKNLIDLSNIPISSSTLSDSISTAPASIICSNIPALQTLSSTPHYETSVTTGSATFDSTSSLPQPPQLPVLPSSIVDRSSCVMSSSCVQQNSNISCRM